MLASMSKYIVYPVWDLWDSSKKLKRLAELERMQWLSVADIKNIQSRRLQELISHAASSTTFYKKYYEDSGVDIGSLKFPEDIERLPIVSKKDVRESLMDMIAEGNSMEDLSCAKTGGSTGLSLDLYFDKDTQERRNAAAMMTDRWSGWDLGEKRAAVWGNPPVAKSFKEKVRSAFLDRMMFLDTMALNDKSMAEFVDQWRVNKPTMMFGHSHSIYMFALYLLDKGIFDLRPKGIVSTSMMLLDHERSEINRAFGCKVFNRYGCEEVGLIASECEYHNGFHLNINDVYVEFINIDGLPCKAGEQGKIVITDLNNYAMPLIRYSVEDVGVPSDRVCKCGRGLPIMESVVGRVADFLKRVDGTLVAGVSLVERTLTAVAGVEQMQLVQNKLEEVVVYIVKSGRCDKAIMADLTTEFESALGKNMKIIYKFVEVIPQEKTGKYRFSICNI